MLKHALFALGVAIVVGIVVTVIGIALVTFSFGVLILKTLGEFLEAVAVLVAIAAGIWYYVKGHPVV